MAGLNDFPALKELHDKLRDEEAAIREKTAKLWSEYNDLHAKATPFEVKMRELQNKIKAIEQPRLGELCNELSAIARATGGRAISDAMLENT